MYLLSESKSFIGVIIHARNTHDICELQWNINDLVIIVHEKQIH